MDVGQYLGVFLDESKEHLQGLNDNIMTLEQDPTDENCINEIFRAAHSLKGMAGTMGFKRMQELTHHMEDVFSDVRAGQLKVNGDMIDQLFKCLDALEGYVTLISDTQDEGTDEHQDIINALNEIRTGKPAEDAAAGKADETPAEGESAADGGADGPAWKKINIKDHDKSRLEEAKAEGKNLFGATVNIQESCILKAARAFLVFKGLEEIGEIIVSDPSTQDIEDEKFELSFSIIIATEESKEKVIEVINHVSEIESVDCGEFDPAAAAAVKAAEEAEENAEAAAAAPEPAAPAAQTTAPAPAAAPAAKEGGEKGAAQGGKKPAGKPAIARTVRVDIDKLDVLMNLVSELIIAKNSLISAATSDKAEAGSVNEQIEYLESVTTNLHESVMKVRMVPIDSVTQKFPRMIRDLNRSLGKPMELTMTGEDTEMDRTVVDEIGDPLMHLLRNSADHGIEPPAERVAAGKPETGQIFLHAYQDGNNVVIEVGDDGRGIDVEAVKRKGIERGVITPEQGEAMSEKAIIGLLFNAGFSTAKTVSEISGRGVGLDVVKSKVESLNGEVDVRTKLGEGSTWIIRLPVTMAIIQALMVKVGGETYAIPLDSIQIIEDVAPEEIKFVQNKEVINLRGSVTPLIRLSESLEVESNQPENANMVVVIVKKGEQQAGLVIDEMLGQLEIVIKPLGKYTSRCKFISGATILGDGEIALILDTNALV
ncbi:MAG: chemotaxis protein CheA [Lachnospiraceae bacterium]|nr:chemotaxis protein CheA [Lachnospiraceae bacterium]